MTSLRAGSSSVSGLTCSLTRSQKNSETVIRTVRRLFSRNIGSLLLTATLVLLCDVSIFAQAPTLAPAWTLQ